SRSTACIPRRCEPGGCSRPRPCAHPATHRSRARRWQQSHCPTSAVCNPDPPTRERRPGRHSGVRDRSRKYQRACRAQPCRRVPWQSIEIRSSPPARPRPCRAPQDERCGDTGWPAHHDDDRDRGRARSFWLWTSVSRFQIGFPQVDIHTVTPTDVVTPELPCFESHYVQRLSVFSLIVRNSVGKHVTAMPRGNDADFPPHISGKLSVFGNLNVT